MEIEHKFLISCLPESYDAYPSHQIEQAYLCTEPVVRIHQEDDSSYLTYKSKGLLFGKEYSLSLTREVYAHPLPKADGVVLTKKRYLIPPDSSDYLTTELDVFEGRYAGLLPVEVEFTSEEEAMAFQTPEWFGRGVTLTREHQNSRLACGK